MKRGYYAKMKGLKTGHVGRKQRTALQQTPRVRNKGTGAGTSCPHNPK